MHASRFSLAQIGAGAALLAVGVFAAYRLSTPASAENGVRAANVAVNCEPSQQAVIRQMVGKGDPLVSVECVTTGAAMTPAAFDQYGRPIGASYMPAVYNVPADTVYAPAPRVVRSAAPVRRASTTSARVGEPKRSWQKTALIIGGSTGAGAGIGGLIGGKKGALIGAAIGGGASTLYEAKK